MKSVSVTRPGGFTIVELLIVIVVIAILATISIVAYSGIQARAENTKTITGVGAYTKIFALYAADTGVYPSTSVYPCLDVSATGGCGRVAGSGGCGFSGLAPYNAAFYTLLSQYATTLPTISLQTLSCGGETYRGAYVNKNDTNPKVLTIVVYLRGNVNCPDNMGSASLTSRGQSDDTTMCRLAMPTL